MEPGTHPIPTKLKGDKQRHTFSRKTISLET